MSRLAVRHVRFGEQLNGWGRHTCPSAQQIAAENHCCICACTLSLTPAHLRHRHAHIPHSLSAETGSSTTRKECDQVAARLRFISRLSSSMETAATLPASGFRAPLPLPPLVTCNDNDTTWQDKSNRLRGQTVRWLLDSAVSPDEGLQD